MKLIVLYMGGLLLIANQLSAQLPDCSNPGSFYGFGDTIILNYQYSPDGSTYTENTIPIPRGATGFAVGPNINSSNQINTFYTIVQGQYHYYNGSTWVNSFHSPGPGVNIAAGGGFIYSYDNISGRVFRYDGTNHSIYLTTLPIGIQADITADCDGNFYSLRTLPPYSLDQYNSSGILINSWQALNINQVLGGATMAFVNGKIIFGSLFGANYEGEFIGNTIVFSLLADSTFGGNDLGSCPTPFIAKSGFGVAVCNFQLPYTWNNQVLTSPGYYTHISTGTLGCDTLYSLKLDLIPNPVPQLGPDTMVCRTNPINISPGIFPGYLWNTGATTEFILVSSPGKYIVEVENNEGCKGIDSINVVETYCPDDPCNVSINTRFYPNPFNKELIVEKFPTACKVSMNLYNNIGQAIFTNKKLNDGINRIALPLLASGQYYYKLHSEGRTLLNGKLMKVGY